jgi:exopolysaccharide production protein ExoQ
MPPSVAALVCGVFIGYLFWADLRRGSQGHSIALWVPLIWMFLAGSRWASAWLDLSTPMASADDYAEGSPVDRAVFLALIAAGVVILYRRRIDWTRLLLRNIWIVLYLTYCLASITWTDEPFILLKRWIKDLGNPIMALVILTEQRPYDATATILRRLSFLLLPLSALFVRYFPALGRAYRPDGSMMLTGVGHQKNDLGAMCLISGIYFSWKFLQKRRCPPRREKSRLTDLVLVAMLMWLLYLSNSQTSVVCLLSVVLLFLLSHVRPLAHRPARIVAVVLMAATLLYVFEEVFHLKDSLLGLLGRDSSLTNRTEVWQVLKELEVDPLFGAGFMSFWTGARLTVIWKTLGSGINQAHSGYLEQYLNLGYAGLAFIAAIMLSTLLKIRVHLSMDAPAAMLRLSFVVTAVLYNYTEASFYGVNNIWLLFMVAAIDISGQQKRHAIKTVVTSKPSETAPIGWTVPTHAPSAGKQPK